MSARRQAARAENPEDMCVCDTHTAGYESYWSCIWRTLADRDLKMSCIDAPRRQLLRKELGSKLIFDTSKVMARVNS
jgi:hypothetical protein